MPKTYHIFLSYSRTDSDMMRRMTADLRRDGFVVWNDDSLEPGTSSWKSAIEEAYDWGRKFTRYQTLESLQEYVLISQDSSQIDRYLRQPDNQWLLTVMQSSEEQIELASIDCTLRAADVYRQVKFDQPEMDEGVDGGG